MTNWWQYKPANLRPSALQIPKPKEQPKKSGGGILGFKFSDVLNVASFPAKTGGAFLLDKLNDYNKRFVTPTAAWGLENLLEVNERLGTLTFDTGGVHYIRGDKARLFFGHKLSDRKAVNPLRAYIGDDEEIAKAEEMMSQLPFLSRMLVETVFDPSTWLTAGSGAVGKLMVKQGAGMLGKSRFVGAGLESALEGKNATRLMLKGVPGSKRILGEATTDADLWEFLMRADVDPVAKTLIGSGALLNAMSGVPEAMFEGFLNMSVRPVMGGIKFLPRLKVIEGEQGVRLGLEFTNPSKISARSYMDNTLNMTNELVDNLTREVIAENGGQSIFGMEGKVFEKLLDDSIDPSNLPPWASEGLKNIREGVDMQDVLWRAKSGRHIEDLKADLNSKLVSHIGKKFGLATKEQVEKLPTIQKAVAKLTRLDSGMRFFNSKLAATWMHGVLFSPFYIVQNGVTDSWLAGLKWGMRQEDLDMVMPAKLSELMGQLAQRSHVRQYFGMSVDEIDDVAKLVERGIGQESTILGGMYYSGVSKKNQGGYIVHGVDSLAKWSEYTPVIGKPLGNALRASVRLPHGAAAAFDIGSYRGIVEDIYGKRLIESLSLGTDNTLAQIPERAESMYRAMINVGVPERIAGQLEKRYINSLSREEFIQGIRRLADDDIVAFGQWIPADYTFSAPMPIIKKLQDAVQNNYRTGTVWQGREAIEGGTKLKHAKRVKYSGVDEVLRKDWAEYIGSQIEDVGELSHNAMGSLLDEIADKHPGLYSNLVDFLDESTNINRSMTRRTRSLLTHKKAVANDIKLYSDILLQDGGVRQALNRTIVEALDEGTKKGGVNIISRMGRNKDAITLTLQRAEKEGSEFIADAVKTRLKIIKDPSNRELWGDFAAKWDLDKKLGKVPDLDELDNFIREGHSSIWSNHINDVRAKMGLAPDPVKFVSRYTDTLFAEANNYVRKVQTGMDAWHKVKNKAALIAEQYADEMLQNDPGVASSLNKIHNRSINRAMDEANDRLGNFFSGATNMDEFMSYMFPFARFGLRAMSMGSKAMARNPWMLPMFERWTYASEKKMSPIPGYVPFLGNLYSNPLSGLLPYQQFQQLTDPRIFGESDFNKMEQTMGLMSIAPGPVLAAALTALEQDEFEGAALPGQRGVTRPMSLLGKPFNVPEDVLQRVTDAVYGTDGDAALERETERVLADEGLVPAEVDKDSDEYKNARKKAIMMGAIGFASGNQIKVVPRERIEWAKKQMIAFAEQGGIPTEQQIMLRRADVSPWSLVNDEVKDKIISVIGEHEFKARASVTPTGLSPEERRTWHGIQSYFTLSSSLEKTTDDQLRELGQKLMDGVISGKEFREEKRLIFLEARAVRDGYKRAAISKLQGGDILDAEKFSDDEVEEMFQGMRMSLKNKTDTTFAEDVALEQYRSIQPEMFADPITGEVDWNAYEKSRDMFLSMTPYSRYIERIVDNKRMRDPVLDAYEEAKLQMDEYNTIPRYRNILPEEQELAYEAVKAVGAAQSTGKTKKEALFEIQRVNPRASILARIALKSPNPLRKNYWKQHPLLQIFFSDDIVVPYIDNV